jgi:hypothetical protein
MKRETKIAKFRAQYIRNVWLLTKEDSLSKLAITVGFNRGLIATVLREHDPELYIRLNAHLHDYLLLDLKPKLLGELNLEKESVKFKLFVEQLKKGNRDKQELAIKCNVSLRQIYRYVTRLKELTEEVRCD